MRKPLLNICLEMIFLQICILYAAKQFFEQKSVLFCFVLFCFVCLFVLFWFFFCNFFVFFIFLGWHQWILHVIYHWTLWSCKDAVWLFITGHRYLFILHYVQNSSWRLQWPCKLRLYRTSTLQSLPSMMNNMEYSGKLF